MRTATRAYLSHLRFGQLRRDREREKANVEQRLQALEQVGKLPDLDRDELEHVLRDRLEDWRGLLGRHIGQARQILRKLLVGRLVVTPEGDHAEVTGTGSLGPFLSGIILPKGMASPRGVLPFTVVGAVAWSLPV